MDPRDIAKSNGVSFSIDPVYVGVVPGTNWGVPYIPQLIALDPTVGAQRHDAESALGSRDFLTQGGGRRRMTELANEFASIHDELLRELAR